MKDQLLSLEGAPLDAAVARSLGAKAEIRQFASGDSPRCILLSQCLDFEAGTPFAPSSRWTYGGPIIEREEIELKPHGYGGGWSAIATRQACHGLTPLIAAMRAFAASKLGEWVALDLAPEGETTKEPKG